jgi:hypothetical protein
MPGITGTIGGGEPGEFRPAVGDQLLIGCDHGFSGPQRPFNPFASRRHAADEFGHHVHIGRENNLDILGPDRVRTHIGGRLGNTLPRHVTVVDVGERHIRHSEHVDRLGD